MSKLFIIGMGFCGRELARRQQALGWDVVGTHRPGRAEESCFEFDRTHPLPKSALDGVTHLLASVPPDESGDPAFDWLRTMGPCQDLEWVGYLSTTGVYGDHHGAWVTEASELLATMGRSARRIEAERAWLNSGFPAHIFRLPAIYGAGRSALDSVERGTAHRVIRPGYLFGRIHVADVAHVIAASFERPNPGAIYNVSDNEPAEPGQVIEYACKLLGVEPPPEVTWEQAHTVLSPMAQSFYLDNKKVDNSRIKTELGVTLLYPNFRAGLDALLQERKG